MTVMAVLSDDELSLFVDRDVHVRVFRLQCGASRPA